MAAETVALRAHNNTVGTSEIVLNYTIIDALDTLLYEIDLTANTIQIKEEGIYEVIASCYAWASGAGASVGWCQVWIEYDTGSDWEFSGAIARQCMKRTFSVATATSDSQPVASLIKRFSPGDLIRAKGLGLNISYAAQIQAPRLIVHRIGL